MENRFENVDKLNFVKKQCLRDIKNNSKRKKPQTLKTIIYKAGYSHYLNNVEMETLKNAILDENVDIENDCPNWV